MDGAGIVCSTGRHGAGRGAPLVRGQTPGGDWVAAPQNAIRHCGLADVRDKPARRDSVGAQVILTEIDMLRQGIQQCVDTPFITLDAENGILEGGASLSHGAVDALEASLVTHVIADDVSIHQIFLFMAPPQCGSGATPLF